MYGSNKRYGKNNAAGQKRISVFAVILIACFVIVPAVLFIIGMRGASDNAAQPDDDSPAIINPTLLLPSAPPEPEDIAPTMKPMPPAVKVKGIYYNVYYPENDAFERTLDFIEATAVNAIVIDVKEDHGYFTFETDNEILRKAHDVFADRYTGDIIAREAISDLKARGIYTIARVVCFKDDLYAGDNPSLAFQSKSGGVWRDSGSTRWLDPYKKESWEYIAEVCREAAEIGFDEIQLDYVRFPSDGPLGDIKYSELAEEKTKDQIINEFAAFIRDEMRFLGVRTSADILGIVGISNIDAAGVGQNVQLLLGSLESICPMIYPSHFANSAPVGYAQGNGVGQNINGILFERPDTEPYEVVYNTLQHYKRQLDQFQAANPGVTAAVIRPYLQYNTASYLPEGYWITYGPEEIHAQINAVTDAGFEEWILWRSVNNNFDPDVIP